MKDWIKAVITSSAAAVVTAIAAAAKFLWNRRKQEREKQEADRKAQEDLLELLKEAMLAVLHDRIFSTYTECAKKKFAAPEEIRNTEYLYKPYHALGGNGTGTEFYERITKMPTEPPSDSAA